MPSSSYRPIPSHLYLKRIIERTREGTNLCKLDKKENTCKIDATSLEMAYLLAPVLSPITLTLMGCRMGRSDKVSLWYVALLINTRFRFFF